MRPDVAGLRLGILARLADAVGLAETLGEVAERGVAVLQQNDVDHPAVWLLGVDGERVEKSAPGRPPAEDPGVHDAEAHALARAAARSGRHEIHPLTSSPAGLAELHAQPVLEPGQVSSSVVLVVGVKHRFGADAEFADYLEVAAALLGAGFSGRRELAVVRQQTETLRELDVAKSAFLANVSHELRTPLALIAGPLDDLLAAPAEEVPERLRERLGTVRGNVVRLTRMVDAMLDFSRMEAGRITPNLVELDVAALLASLAASFGPAIERAGLRFGTDLNPLPRSALLDRDIVERIVLNLLSNALKYTPQGSVDLALHPVRGGFEVTVADTGIGIAVRDQEKVFARFEQLPRHAQARSTEGAGIGLAMVRELSRLLGGDVDLRSAPGRGSTFTVRLPYVPPQARDEAEGSRSITPRGAEAFLADVASWEVAEQPASVQASEPRADRPLLLVVEDSADLARYLAEVLGDDYQVELARDGLQALAAARARRPEAILSDVMMPGLDGFGLVAEIRADPALRDLPVLLLSARAGLDATTAGLEQGADDYLVKPFDVSELRARLASNILRAAERSAEAAWRRAVLSALHEAVVLREPGGLVVELNAAFSRLFGWTMDDGPFTPPYPWWPDPADAPDWVERIEAAMKGLAVGGALEAEYPMRHRDGRTVWVRAASGAVEIPGRGRRAVLTTFWDVTRDHESQQRRQEAARITADFASADALDQVVGVAVDGLHALFNGDSTVQVAGPGVVHTFTASGPIEVDLLPQAIAQRLSGTADEPAPDEPVDGILLVPPSAASGTRAWVQFGRPRVVGTDEQIVADMLAQAFALAVDRVQAVGELADKQANLEKAIESHRMIGQAVGVLVERYRLTPGQAFQQLRHASQDRNVRLREIARRVLETGLDPVEA